jgi:hypothetical protein
MFYSRPAVGPTSSAGRLLHALGLGAESRPELLIPGSSTLQYNGEISPDGRWIESSREGSTSTEVTSG